MKVLLGSGEQKEDGYLSLDISKECHPDIVADIREPWTWATEPIEELKADNLTEHLTPDERIDVMNEAWDRMKPGGMFWIRGPLLKLDEDHLMGAFSDPTHKSYFTMETWDYWDIDHPRGRVYGRDYGIKLWKIQRKEEWGAKFFIVELIKP